MPGIPTERNENCHDAALQKLHIVLAVDRAGFVGSDGATHQGLFDPAFCNAIPGLTVYAPTYFDELRCMHWDGVVGTLAGDDTIFIVTRNENAAVSLVSELKKLLVK